MAWGPVYGLLRRHGGLRPLGAGLVTGATLSLIVDEGLTPAVGFSAPNRAYPAATHVRGFLAHLVWGVVAALATEAVWRVTRTEPDQVGPPASLPAGCAGTQVPLRERHERDRHHHLHPSWP
jgi:uncharacterized membrane protein YagU involved in acid resistance